MNKQRRIWFNIFSDLFVNLAAGWFGGTTFLVFSEIAILVKIGLLTLNIALAIVSLVIAFALRKKAS